MERIYDPPPLINIIKHVSDSIHCDTDCLGAVVSDRDKGFYFGVAICVAEIVRLHDEPTQAKDLCDMTGLTIDLAKKAGVEYFDMKELRKVLE